MERPAILEEHAPPAGWQPGSVWGVDGRYYPCEEERSVPLSGVAIRLIFSLYAALRYLLYPAHERVYVAADQFIYWVPGDPTRSIAPDVWVCFGVPKEPERAVFRTWEEGAIPGFVVEVSSKDSRAEDRMHKLPIYRDVLECREYLIYDVDSNELLLYRRQGAEFVLVEPSPDGRLYSEEVGAWFGREPDVLGRVYDASKAPVLNPEETYALAEVEARIRHRLETEAADRAREARAARRREREARREARALAADNERLRAELERLRAERGDGQ